MAPTLHPFLQHQLELYELLQHLHQQQPELALHWRAPGPGLLKRHLANLPRLRWVPEADCHLLVAPALELLSNPPQSPSPLLLSDPFPVNPQALTALLLLGYRSPGSNRLLEPLHREITPNAGLRILVLTNLYPPQELGGYGRSIFDFTNHLRLLGHNVQVLSSNAPYLGGDTGLDRQVDRGLLLLGSYEGGLHPITDPQERERRTQHNRQQLQIQIQEFQPQACLVGNLDMVGPEPLHQLSHHHIPCWHHHGFSQAAFPADQLPSPTLYQPVANSHFSARAIAAQLPAHSPIPVIYPGAQTHLFSSLNQTPLAEGLRIGFAGLLIGAKGPHVLLEALYILKKQQLPFECVLAGGSLFDDYPRQLEQYVEQQGLSAQVRFVGKLERHQLRNFFEQCNVFVFPSTWEEPFGISQVEALAAGLLVVSSGTGGAGETVHDDINGRRFQPSNSSDLAQVLADISRNPQLHEPLRKRGRQLAQSHFDTGRETTKLAALIHAGVYKSPASTLFV